MTWQYTDSTNTVVVSADGRQSRLASVLSPADLTTVLPAPAPTPEQQYAAAIAAGCAIVSTGTPALDGTYALDAGSISDIQSEQAFIAAYTEFSTATPTMAWPVVGGAVTFPTTTAALAVFKALAQYVTGWKQFAASISTAAPSQPVTIT